MSKSTILSDAIHILVYIQSDKEHSLTSTAIANSINTNPALVRKIMKSLREAGIISTKQGKSEPKLVHSPDEVSLKDIYIAVDNGFIFKPDYNTADFCYIGKSIAPVLEKEYSKLQDAMLNELEKIKLSDIIYQIDKQK